ncbi:DUF21 domain-containing protein At1g47330 [Ancistrocladus abbreviatus]
MAGDVKCCGTTFSLYILSIVGLVAFAGLMAGLTLGLMSLGLVDLEVLIKSGRPQDRIHACTILPQAICTRYGLVVGATVAPLVRVLLMLFFPIAYPISKVLDWMLGKGHAVLLRRAELKTFVTFHGNEAGKGGDLTHDETTIISGALELTEKTAKDAMTPISKAFALDLDATINLETLNAIMTMGHSRVPVYYQNPLNIIGLILVKNLLAVDPDHGVPLRKMIIRKVPRVSENMPLYDILNEFQKGHSHIAVVYKDLNESKGRPQETEEEHDGAHGAATKSIHGDAQDARVAITGVVGGQQLKKTPVFKKRHRGCSFCILDLDNAPIPEFPPNELVVGVITMEDVIEELLQEEILDETDEYVNIHNRIKVNMSASYEKLPDINALQQSSETTSVTTLPNSAAAAPGSPGMMHQGSDDDIPRDR